MNSTKHRSRLFIDALLACAGCLVLALVAPLSLWESLGSVGSALAILAFAGAATGLVVWRGLGRNRRSKLVLPLAIAQHS